MIAIYVVYMHVWFFIFSGSRGVISPRQVYETEITHCVLYISGVRAILSDIPLFLTKMDPKTKLIAHIVSYVSCICGHSSTYLQVH